MLCIYKGSARAFLDLQPDTSSSACAWDPVSGSFQGVQEKLKYSPPLMGQREPSLPMGTITPLEYISKHTPTFTLISQCLILVL